MNVTVMSALLSTNTTSLSDGYTHNASQPSTIDDVVTLSSLMTSTPTSQQPQEEEELSLTERLLLLSAEERARAEDILLVIRYVIFVISLPATLVNVAVFLQPALRSATSVFVISLSLAQLVYILTNVVGRVMYAAIENPSTSKAYLIYGVYVSSYLGIVVRRANYLVMCYLSLERLYAVLRPLHIKQFLLTRFPLTVTAITYFVAAVWHVYMLAKSSIREVRSSRTGKMVYIFVYTDIYKKNPEIADGFAAAAPVLMTYIPLLVLMALNVTTVWALRRHNTNHMQSTANEDLRRQRERQMTRTILATTVIYIILSLPYAFHNIFKAVFTEFDKRQKYENMYYVSRSVAFTLTLLSCALDFFCFLLLSSNFRNTFFALFRLRRAKGGKQSMAEVSGSMVTSRSEVDTKY
ncbi:uncharacterized protein LOC143300260 [Babylonia areolata]|uniref:uncharacterized protein LOC143300260 n=1 Tax=Babylonia areolata TaxID=304850 RepID=UPI003FD33CF5